jgi:BCD family chlorophyll transporter-like MFS transporter
MGLWGAAQAVAAGFGGLLGAVLVDLGRTVLLDATAFGLTFALEAGLFLISAAIALRVLQTIPDRRPMPAGLAIPGE